MAKKLTFSIDNFEYNQYFSGITGNKSSYIRQLIRLGFDSNLGDTDNYKTKIFRLSQEIYEKNTEIQKLKAEIGRKDRLLQKKNEEQSSLYDSEEIEEFKKILSEDEKKRSFFDQAFKILNRDSGFFNNLFTSYKSNFGDPDMFAKEFHKMMMMYRDIRGETNNENKA